MKSFLRFCAVGTIGFLIDAGILQLLVSGTHANPYAARVVSFFAAASTTWFLNRRFTFQVAHSATRKEWLHYVGLMTLGACVNYGTYAACITFWLEAKAYPWYGVAVGSIAALGVNFTSSRLLFRRSDTHSIVE